MAEPPMNPTDAEARGPIRFADIKIRELSERVAMLERDLAAARREAEQANRDEAEAWAQWNEMSDVLHELRDQAAAERQVNQQLRQALVRISLGNIAEMSLWDARDIASDTLAAVDTAAAVVGEDTPAQETAPAKSAGAGGKQP